MVGVESCLMHRRGSIEDHFVERHLHPEYTGRVSCVCQLVVVNEYGKRHDSIFEKYIIMLTE
jgi:hypothetical protein